MSYSLSTVNATIRRQTQNLPACPAGDHRTALASHHIPLSNTIYTIFPYFSSRNDTVSPRHYEKSANPARPINFRTICPTSRSDNKRQSRLTPHPFLLLWGLRNMRATRWLCWCLVILGWGLVASASAQQGVRWQVDLETAKRLASQTNRMVLVHFWADWCLPCRQMEEEVFVRPEVAAAVESSFVPVKVNADYFPHTRQQYGVTVLPSDVILAPDGQLVGRMAGTSDPSRYVGQLNQIAAAARNRGPGSYGQPGLELASRQPAGPPTGSPGAQRPVAQRPAAMGNPGARFVGRVGEGQPGQMVPAGQRYARSNSPELEGPPSIKIPPATEVSRNQSPPVDARTQTALPGGVVSPNPAGPNLGDYASQVPASQPQAAESPRPGAQLPPGNPPLGLDGFCAVELSDNRRWVQGDLRWGLVHRGRTYLFAGPEQRDRFDAAPDRYAPVSSGSDVVAAIERGETLPGRREHGAWFEGRVYLFSSEATLRKFDAAPHRYVSALLEKAQNTARRPMYGAPAAERATPASVPQAPYGRWR